MQFSLKGNYISLETSKWFGEKMCSTVLFSVATVYAGKYSFITFDFEDVLVQIN